MIILSNISSYGLEDTSVAGEVSEYLVKTKSRLEDVVDKIKETLNME